jgi:hypothetical protein
LECMQLPPGVIRLSWSTTQMDGEDLDYK